MKNNFSKWVALNNFPLPESLSEITFIKCYRCDYITHPIVTRCTINNIKYGILRLPNYCPKCKRKMEDKHD